MIDTEEKRRSMLSFGRAGFTLPVADGGFDGGDRRHLLGQYAFSEVLLEVELSKGIFSDTVWGEELIEPLF